MSEEVSQKRPNRKRKKSFLKNARKYAKKEWYGRGSHLEADIYQYFVRVMEAYREGFDSEEDKSIFVNNVFEQTLNHEVNYSCNQVGCRLIETLLPYANEDVLKRFMTTFGADLRPLVSDYFASHVLEALIITACKHSLDNNSSSKDDCKQFVLKVSKFLLNNLEDYVWDTCGNHVIRTCLQNLLGLQKQDISSKNEGECRVPTEYLEIVQDCAQRIILWPQFNELCNSELTSGFLQVLLVCTQKADPKLLKKYLKKLLRETFVTHEKDEKEHVLEKVFLSRSLLMLLEISLQIAPTKIFSKIFTGLFENNLVNLAKVRSTNFAVQKLFQSCTKKTEFENMFDEVIDYMGEIMESGHSGVLLALAQTCQRLCAKQGSFVQALMKFLGCSESEERQNDFILCLCRMKPSVENKKLSNDNLQKEKLNLHGTLILQALLGYNKPIKIINIILNLDSGVLKDLFSNSMGSHIVDSFVTGLFIGEKSREKLVRKIMGSYRELAASKYGSRSFEALYGVASLKCKIQIMEELAIKDAAWSNTDYGRIIAGKVNLVLYKSNKEKWKNSLNKVDRNEKMLAEVLN